MWNWLCCCWRFHLCWNKNWERENPLKKEIEKKNYLQYEKKFCELRNETHVRNCICSNSILETTTQNREEKKILRFWMDSKSYFINAQKFIIIMWFTFNFYETQFLLFFLLLWSNRQAEISSEMSLCCQVSFFTVLTLFVWHCLSLKFPPKLSTIALKISKITQNV